MSIWRLVVREILYRKLGFALGLLAVAVAVGSLVAALTLLRAHDVRTDEVMRRMEDAHRKTMKDLGFNVVIIPKGQNLGDFYADDFASKYMPEEYVERLAASRIVTVRHLLPSLQQKLKWPERERTIILVGVRGEVPMVHRNPLKPLLEPVPRGGMVVGHELHRSLGLKAGDSCELLGKDFTVAKLHDERGTKDDITVWINLGEAQEMLDKKGLINGILALECKCAWADLDKVREDISRILPETQVIEKATKALVRAEARKTAAETRARLRKEREDLAAILVPVVIACCGVWIALLSFANVRERRAEIGILRALGLRSRQILLVFLGKAIMIGLVGAIVGYLAGWLGGAFWAGALQGGTGLRVLFDPWALVLALAAAPVLSGVAGWVPAVLAAQADPAEVLQEE